MMKYGLLLTGLGCVLLSGCSRAAVEVAEREIVVQLKDDTVRFPDQGDCLKALPDFMPDHDKTRLTIPLAHFRKAGSCQLTLEAVAADNLELDIDAPKRADVAFARCAKNAYELKKEARSKGKNIVMPEIVVSDDGGASLVNHYNDTDLRCLMEADGTLGLVLHATAGAQLTFPTQTATVPDSGEITVAVNLSGWLAKLPLAALNSDSVAEAAKMGTWTISLQASLDGDKHSRNLQLNMPYVVRPEAKYRRLHSRETAALTENTEAMAVAYIRAITAASKSGKDGAAPKTNGPAVAGSALLLIGDDVYSSGDSATLGSAARIGIAESSKTEKLDSCGPYELSGGGDAFQNRYISHSLIERRVAAFARDGRRIEAATFRPEPSCPSRTSVPQFDVHKGFVNATPPSVIFKWMAGLK